MEPADVPPHVRQPEVHEYDAAFMEDALNLARSAERAGEVPVGAVLVDAKHQIIGRGANSVIARNDATAHAEIVAIREASALLQNYRLENTTMYVTLEPCVMCAGALIHARVHRLVFGARDLRFGGARSKFRIADSDLLNHQLIVTEGVCAVACAQLLKAFFECRR